MSVIAYEFLDQPVVLLRVPRQVDAVTIRILNKLYCQNSSFQKDQKQGQDYFDRVIKDEFYSLVQPETDYGWPD